MDRKEKIGQLIIARLNGGDINKRFKYYQSLVRKGIGGFIVFGGELKQVKKGIEKLNKSAEVPLFIASDLEQGLGQQIKGGTLFPMAMAIGKAINPKDKNDIRLLQKSLDIISKEAKAAGINVIFSPVVDVNTNPENPIVCTRAFSDNPVKTAWFGNKFIKGFQEHGLFACAKHFPGHGDTARDSHKELPVIKAGKRRLFKVELYPFKQAIKAGVKMIMVGHLKVPVLDSRSPSSLSQKVIQGLLRKELGFKGLVLTDAMNMHAVSKKGRNSETKACLRALNAGADILLHPESPEKVIDYLTSKWEEIKPRVEESFQRVLKAKNGLIKVHSSQFTVHSIGAKSSRDLAYKLTCKSIIVKNKLTGLKENPVVLIIDDDNHRSGDFFVKEIRKRYPGVKAVYIDNRNKRNMKTVLNSFSGSILVTAVFSEISAWKGRSGISGKLKTLLEKAVKASGYSVVAGFCCPYTLRGLKADVVIEAYSGSEQAQEAVAGILCDL